MKSDEQIEQHLSQILTTWTLFRQAHEGSPEAAGEAQRRLLLRYGTPVYRYLLAAVRDDEAAEELYQEFALRFVRGDFHRADPGRGRFRQFLKTALIHLVINHRRKSARRGLVSFPEQGFDPADEREFPTSEEERRFVALWRAELFDRAWAALASFEAKTGQMLHTVLRDRTDHPEDKAPEMALRLGKRLGREISPEWVRKRLHFAREKFTDLIVDEVAASLESPTPEAIEDELIELGLLEHCRSALKRRRDRS
jgi:RNA polymerase sigma-70 factor (ECF subfamily)